MRGFVTLRRIIEALRRAEEIKRELWYCQSLQKLGYCYCREGELCQTALALYLEISKEAIRQFLDRLEFVMENDVPVKIRTIKDIKPTYPRKFISLREEKISLLVEV